VGDPAVLPADAAPDFITRFAPMRAVVGVVERVAIGDAPVLVAGESGSGKRQLARLIHHLSGRSGPLVFIDCLAFTAPALEAELFGSARPDARLRTVGRPGAIELASTGTLVLDGIGMMGHDLQARLLRAVDHGVWTRGAGARTSAHPASPRIISLMSRPLQAAIRGTEFIPGFIDRLGAVSVELPPLRDRVVDIPMLAEHFLNRVGGSRAPALSTEALASLEAYDWPGNVRELRSVIERAVHLARGREIVARDLQLRSRLSTPGAGSPISLEELERAHIEAVLRQTEWHQGRAGDVLGISPKTLYRKMREYGLQRPTSRS
jgi:DNA-binding NtrC family response regulator